MENEIYTDLKAQLPAIQEAMKQGIQWGTDLAGKYIVYDMVISILGIILGIGLGMIIYFLVKIMIKEFKKDQYNDDVIIPCLGGSAFLFIITSAILYNNLIDLIKDIVIPEIRIIELLSNLIK